MTDKTRRDSGIIMLILGLFNLIIMIPFMGPSAMLTTIMGDLNIPVTMGGFIISIYLIMCGLFMFIGSVICNKIGFRETFLLGMACVTFGLFVSAIAGNFAVYFTGRIISGIGYGLAQAALFPIAAIWFHGSKFATVQTIIVVGSCLGVALAYIVFPMFGTWRNATWVFTLLTLVYTLASLLWVKYPSGVGEHLKQARADVKSGKSQPQKTEFGRVFKYKDFVLILVIGIFSMVPNTILLTYMYTYFTTDAGMSVTLATTISSTLTFVQIAGSILGGVLCNATGRRKPFIIASIVVYGAASIGLIAFGRMTALVIVCAILSGVGFYLRMPVLGMYMVEETETPEPAFVAPIAAVTNGLPMLFNIIGGVAGGLLITSVGTGSTILIMHIIALAMVIPALFLDEVGPKSRRVLAAVEAPQAV